jgi:pimeloyl-ACP methyl ester carboxylesterase
LDVLDLEGDPSRNPLVLLHEGLGSVDLWRDLPGKLRDATARRTVAFSRHGHGRSDAPVERRGLDFMDTEARRTLPALLARLGVQRPILIGHSDGASIALIHAAEHEVGGLVLVAPHVFVEEMTLEGIRGARAAFDSGSLRTRMDRHHRDPATTFENWCGVWLDPAFRSWSIEELLPAVTAPMLLIQGIDDKYGTLAQIEVIERCAPGTTSRLVVAGGHSPHLDSPEQVQAEIERFVEPLA